jgi:hypothetical protein
MIEGIDYFEFSESLICRVCNGDEYRLPALIIVKRNEPLKIGWYPLITSGNKNELGKVLSFWDGDNWSKSVACHETKEVAERIAMEKVIEKYWWFAPWWDCEPSARG